MADHTASVPVPPGVFVGMSCRATYVDDGAMAQAVGDRRFARSFGHQKRFYVLSPPLLCRQLIYDRLNRTFIKIRYAIPSTGRSSAKSSRAMTMDLKNWQDMRNYKISMKDSRQNNGSPLIVTVAPTPVLQSDSSLKHILRPRIIAIEPNRENIELARENNRQGDVTFLHAAVGNSDGRGNIVDPKAESWAYRIESDPKAKPILFRSTAYWRGIAGPSTGHSS